MRFYFKKTVLVLAFYSICLLAFSQSIKGVVVNKNNSKPLPKALVFLLQPKDSSILKNVLTDSSGFYQFKDLKNGKYLLSADFIGFKTFYLPIEINNNDIKQRIFLEEEPEEIKGSTIKAKRNPIVQKQDTVEFSSSNYKLNPDATVEDLVKKMPGISSENGVIKAQGEEIKKVTVDGQDYFGDDASAALKNLPAELVSKVQVFDRMSDQAQFTGVDDGNSQKSLNIITKAGTNNGQFGKIYGGYGTEDRWAAGGNVNIFTKKHRFSIIGLSNNINQQNFSTDDISNLMGTTASTNNRGGRGGGRPGGMGGFGNNNSNFLIGQQNGINTTNSFGLNYTLLAKKKLKLSGSYFFNYGKNENQTFLNRTFFITETQNQFYEQGDTSNSNNLNNRLNFRLEYTIDSLNSIIFTPSLRFQTNESSSLFLGINNNDTLSKMNQTFSSSNSESRAFNWSNNLLWRHKFKSSKNSFSLNLNNSMSPNNSENNFQTQNDFYLPFFRTNNFFQNTINPSKNNSFSANASFTKVFNDVSSLEINYNPNFNWSENDGKTNKLDTLIAPTFYLDSLLSNQFKNSSISHKVGFNFSQKFIKWNYTIGFDLKQTELIGKQIFPRNSSFARSFYNILPSAMFTYQFSKTRSIRTFYRTRTNLPSISNLQNILNNSNPLFLRSGNSDLDQDFTHSLFTRYMNTNIKKGTNTFAMLSFSTTRNYIGNSTILAATDTIINEQIDLKKGVQLSLPENLNGFYNFRVFGSYGFPIKKIKSLLNTNLGQTINQVPTLINGRKNLNQTFISNVGLTLTSNISEKLDFSVNYNSSYNVVINSLQSSLNNSYLIQFLNAKVNWMPKEYIVFNTEVNNSLYNGLGADFNQSIWLWNAGLGYKFLKNRRAEIKLSVFDILNQNRSINRTINENYIEDNYTQVLNRFYMLTFTYTIRHFKAK